MFANAATGSSKNITPNREITASNRAGPKGYTWTSPCSKATFARPDPAARS